MSDAVFYGFPFLLLSERRVSKQASQRDWASEETWESATGVNGEGARQEQ